MNLEAQIGTLSERLRQLLAARLLPLGLTIEEYRVLQVLRLAGTLEMTPLAAAARLRMAALSKLADRLSGAELLSRGRDTDDTRRVRLRLTSKGERLAAELKDAADACERPLAEALGQWDYERLVRLLQKLDESFLHPPAQPRRVNRRVPE